jgi:predicted exporter
VQSIQPWIKSGDLGGLEGLTSYLPDEAAQRTAMQRLNEGAGGEGGDAFSTQRIRKTFEAATVAQGFRPGAFDPALADLDAQLHPARPVTLADLEKEGLQPVVSRYLARVGGESRSATFLFPTDRRWVAGPPAEFRAAVEGTDGKVKLTGANVVGTEIKRLFRTDAIIALALGLVLVAVLLSLDFRSLRLTVFGMLQLAVGVLWMVALMSVAGIQMNFVNAFATTMILGVGIDYGIHLIHRIWEERSLTSFGVLETGKAVVMAALTNVAGFGAVALSNYPGVASMGKVCLFGTACCLATSLTLLPALLKLFPEPRTAPPPAD